MRGRAFAAAGTVHELDAALTAAHGYHCCAPRVSSCTSFVSKITTNVGLRAPSRHLLLLRCRLAHRVCISQCESYEHGIPHRVADRCVALRRCVHSLDRRA